MIICWAGLKTPHPILLMHTPHCTHAKYIIIACTCMHDIIASISSKHTFTDSHAIMTRLIQDHSNTKQSIFEIPSACNESQLFLESVNRLKEVDMQQIHCNFNSMIYTYNYNYAFMSMITICNLHFSGSVLFNSRAKKSTTVCITHDSPKLYIKLHRAQKQYSI